VTATVRDRTIFYSSFLVSGIIIGFLIWLIYLKGVSEQLSTTTSVLPAVNASLNCLSACFLIAGYLAIRGRRVSVHRRYMIAALVSSALFLASYIVYHNAHGDTPFQGAGYIRLVYFFILVSHILLTTVALPLILLTFAFALTGKFDAHRKIARITLPAWLYVSVTGVMIFFLLKIFS
jgi:putative membrane protein